MSFEENFKRISELTRRQLDSSSLDTLAAIFANKNFQTDLSEYTYSIRNEENAHIVKHLTAVLLHYAELCDDSSSSSSTSARDQLEKIFNILETMSQIKIEQNPLLLDIMRLLEMEVDFMNGVEPQKILNIVLYLVESQYFDASEFAAVCGDVQHVLKRLPKETQQNTATIPRIIKHLKEANSIKKSLRFFNEVDLFQASNVDDLNEHLLLISKVVNNSEFYCWDLLDEYNSYKRLTQILAHFCAMIVDPTNRDNEIVYDILKSLLPIILKIEQRSMKSIQNFLDEGMFMIVVDLFDNQDLVEFLSDGYLLLLYKIMRIFNLLCRRIVYCSEPRRFVVDERRVFDILCKTRDTFAVLSNVEEIQENKLKPNFRTIIVSIAYLKEKLKPDYELLEFGDYETLATSKRIVQDCYKNISDDYKKKTSLVESEFINEMDCEEVRQVSMFNYFGEGCTLIRTIPDIINYFRVVFSSEATKECAWENFKFFLVSIVYHGLDIEKIVCLNCLTKFSEASVIRTELAQDRELIHYLTQLYAENESRNDLKDRLNNMIAVFLANVRG